MIVDAILGHVYGRAPTPVVPEPELYELPENLGRFFSDRAASAEVKGRTCCPPAEQQVCCDAEAKEHCCDVVPGEGCGCR